MTDFILQNLRLTISLFPAVNDRNANFIFITADSAKLRAIYFLLRRTIYCIHAPTPFVTVKISFNPNCFPCVVRFRLRHVAMKRCNITTIGILVSHDCIRRRSIHPGHNPISILTSITLQGGDLVGLLMRSYHEGIKLASGMWISRAHAPASIVPGRICNRSELVITAPDSNCTRKYNA